MYLYSLHCYLNIPSGNEKGNLSSSEELPQLVIILLLLLGVKGLKALIHLHIEDSKELEVEQSQLKDALLQKHCQNIN